jgi:two-component system chemotaxis sensor kinase CheA
MPYDRDLLAIFSGEQAEHIQRLRALADSLGEAAGEARAAAFDEALRRAHTLKGAARAVGLAATEQSAHRLETLFAEAAAGRNPWSAESAAAVHRALDSMEDVLAEALHGPAEAAPADSAYLRVAAANVDNLVRASSQLVALMSGDPAAAAPLRAARALNEFEALKRSCVPFLRVHEEDVEANPIRECLEFADRELRALAGAERTAGWDRRRREWELRRHVADVHQTAVRVRMIPAESVFGAFGAMVRQIAQDDGKRIVFRAEGLDVQADRVVLQSLKDPVMHLLRNAVSHGIETPAERLAAGKPPEGSVRLRFETEGSRLKVTVQDDGRGVDTAAVRRQAIASGIQPEAAQKLDELLFRPGFSTSARVSKLSGRGVGLAVVKEAADRLHGKVEVRAAAPRGLAVVISVGLSVSTQQVLILEAAGRPFALPTQHIQQLTRARVSALRTAGGREVLAAGGGEVLVARLSDLLGLAAPPAPESEEREPDPWIYVAAMAFGEQTLGLLVDRLADERDAVIKDLGLPPGAAGMTAGGVALEDGRVALLLSPAALLERFLNGAAQPVRPAAAPAEAATRRILIVDDSLTTRSLEKSILEAHGFQVAVSVDGLDALEKLGRESFDLVITDVVMPRMDGMQLLEEMKKRRAMEKIPVIMLTSLESREDRQRGMALGADAYLVKRKFDQQELLRTVRQIL